MRKIYVLLGTFLLAGAAVAQAPYAAAKMYKFEGDKHEPGSVTFTDMRDVQAGHFDRATYFSEDFDDGALGGWTADVAFGPTGFESTSTGHANDAGSSFVIPALLTSTSTAWVLLDSDSDGSMGVEEMATLTSPVIDLTAGGLTGGPVYPLKLEMEQFYAGWQSDTIFLEISDDAGASWDQIEIANNEVGREGRPNPELVSINITSYIVDPTQVQIRFRWHGNWDYGWQFDNVQILDLPDNDITVSTVFRGDYVNGYLYSYVPQDQAAEFVIGADLKNIGFLDQSNIGFDWEILDPSSSVVASGTSSTIGSLANGENDTVWVNTGFTATDLGQYTINFDAFADAAEATEDEANNSMTDDHYELTEYTYGADYGTPSGAFYNWSGNDGLPASIGNVFGIENDGVVGAITSQFNDNENVVDQVVIYSLYRYNNDAGEFEWFTESEEYTTVAADEGEWVQLILEDPMTVSEGDVILAVAGHYGGDPSAGWEMQGPVPQGQVMGTDGSGTIAQLISPSAAAVRIQMLDYTGVEDETMHERFNVYPNPANNELNVALTLIESENTTVNILDISGKTLQTVAVGDINGDRNLTIDVSDLSTGVYFVEVVNANGKQNKKFIKK
ncbi:MAG: T9SS type A sorting domain-containing protein [Flavobacteriales bacterium]|nr:T9SS type A sorting domain-containing protein [Flavobacteriales bacterium]